MGFFVRVSNLMIDFTPIYRIAPIYLAALASPGPAFIMVSSMALSRGRGEGVQASFGLALADIAYIIISLIGLAVILVKMQGFVLAVKISGGFYLLYLSYQLWKSSLKPHTASISIETAGRHRHPFLIGLATNLTNPKSIAFLASIFTLALPQGSNLATDSVIVATMGMMTAIWYSLVAVFLSTPSVRKKYLRWSRWIDRVCGTFLALFGVRLLSSLKN